MTTTYKLNANDLSADIVNSIKEAFQNREIEITVSDMIDETTYLLSTEANKNQLYKSMEELTKGEGIPFTLAELQEKYLK
jgi:antitoxin YefM